MSFATMWQAAIQALRDSTPRVDPGRLSLNLPAATDDTGAVYFSDPGPSLPTNRWITGITSETISVVTAAGPTHVTVDTAATYADGDGVWISGNDSTPDLDGGWTATRVSDTEFTLPVTVTDDGTGTGIGEVFFVRKLTFTTAEDVREYELLGRRTGGTGGIRWCEDAVNGASAADVLGNLADSGTAPTLLAGILDGADNTTVSSGPIALSANPNDPGLTSIWVMVDTLDGQWDLLVRTR